MDLKGVDSADDGKGGVVAWEVAFILQAAQVSLMNLIAPDIFGQNSIARALESMVDAP